MVTTRASARSTPPNVGLDDKTTSKQQAHQSDRRKKRLPSLHATNNQIKGKRKGPQKSCEGHSEAELDLLRELGVAQRPPESAAQAAARFVPSDTRNVLSSKRTFNVIAILIILAGVGHCGSVALYSQSRGRICSGCLFRTFRFSSSHHGKMYTCSSATVPLPSALFCLCHPSQVTA
jgi:hypothetical protein